jgi:hypothetical protein
MESKSKLCFLKKIIMFSAPLLAAMLGIFSKIPGAAADKGGDGILVPSTSPGGIGSGGIIGGGSVLPYVAAFVAAAVVVVIVYVLYKKRKSR